MSSGNGRQRKSGAANQANGTKHWTFALKPLKPSLPKVDRKVDAIERLEVDDDATAAMKFVSWSTRSGKVG